MHAALPVAALLALLWQPASTAHAATGARRCEAAIELASGRYALCRLKAEAQLTNTGNAQRLATALASCATRLATSYETALARWGASCPTVEPASAFDATIAQCTTEVAAAAAGGGFPTCGDGVVDVAGEQCDGADLGGLTCTSLGFALGGTLACGAGCALDTSGCTRGPLPASGQKSCFDTEGDAIPCTGTGQDGDTQAGAPLAYVDNGDGTLTDLATGLVWEKLSDDATIHDRDDTYTWDDAFAVKIAALNATGFAGHDDWRVPNVKELQSILAYGSIAPAVSSAFTAGCSVGCTVLACSCTGANPYWSSTTAADDTEAAWIVGFNGGFVVANPKTLSYRVRAVRGGVL